MNENLHLIAQLTELFSYTFYLLHEKIVFPNQFFIIIVEIMRAANLVLPKPATFRSDSSDMIVIM